MRYFRADPAAYEQARAALNAAWGLPNADTVTSLPPAGDCAASGGKVYVCVDNFMCDLPPAPDVLSAAIAAGVAEEVSEAAYCAAASESAPPMP
jgi:hypothetical protein